MNTRTLLASCLLAAASLHAATSTFQGPGTAYLDPLNWSGGVPNTGAGDTAIIDAAAIFTPGGDFAIHAGGLLQINTGGSWTQDTSVAWMQLAGGALTINGGSFNQGTAGAIMKDASTVVTVNSGTAAFAGDYDMAGSTLTLAGGTTSIGSNLVYNAGSLSILSGATLNIGNEFKPVIDFTLAGGTLTANIISLADGLGSLLFQSGYLSLSWTGTGNGIYPGAGSVNFVPGSTGSLFFSGATLEQFNSTDMLTGGRIRYAGAINPAAFTVTESGGGVQVTPVAVPEPMQYGVIIVVGCIAACVRRIAARRA